MNNVVLDRFASQARKRRAQGSSPLPMPESIELSHPVSHEELKKLFMEEETALAPEIKTKEIITERVFSGVEDFAVWYYEERDKGGFSDNQRLALNTLLDAKKMIDSGCKCKRAERKIQAEQYFKVFWTQNQNTDLPQVVKDHLGIPFRLAINGEVFLSFGF